MTLYRLYYLLSWCITPLMPLHSRMRRKRGKDDTVRYRERFGITSLPRPHGSILWVHAASMGESQSVLPLVKRWLQDYPDLHIIFTTVTMTSANFVSSRLPERAMHQFAPYDTPLAMRRFMRKWKPDMVCFVDSELWPNMIHSIHVRNIPLMLLNGRISDNSARRWHKARRFCEKMLTSFTHIYAKSDEDAKRFSRLGAKHVQSFGNMKFSAAPLQADGKALGMLANQIGRRHVWVASSTHNGEEAMIADLHQSLREIYPMLLTIIVPRHDHRGDEITAMLRERGLDCAQRSKNEPISDDIGVYIADTMGELGIFYRLTGIAFVGGSLVPHGGQNPFEPAKLNCAVLYGPYMDNFREFCSALEAASACITVRDADELEIRLAELFNALEKQDEYADAALSVTSDTLDVMDRLYDALQPYVDEITHQSRHEST